MKTLIDPEQFVGMRGNVEPRDDDPFTQEFDGLCIGVREGFLQVRDAEDDVFDVEVSQFTPNVNIVTERHEMFVAEFNQMAKSEVSE